MLTNQKQNIFAERLQGLMDEKSLSIFCLAKEVKIPRTTINNWLNQNRSPNIDYLLTLANYFGCTTDYLLGREN